MSEPKKGVLWGLYAAAGIPLLAVLASAGWLYNDVYATAGKFSQLSQFGSSEGVSLDAETFLSDTGSGSDGWPAMESLQEDFQRLTSDEQEAMIASLRRLATPFGNDSAADFQAFAKAEALVTRYTAVSKSGHFAVPRDWSTPVTSEERFLRPQIQLGRLATAFASAQSRQGSLQGAFNTLEAVRANAAKYAAGGGIGALSGQTLLGTMALTDAATIALTAGSPEAKARFQAFVKDQTNDPQVLVSMHGEACRTVAVFSNSESFDGSVFAGAKMTASLDALQKASAVRMAEFWVATLSDAQSSTNDAIELSKVYRKSIESFVGNKSASSVLPATVARWHEHRLELAAALEVKLKLAAILGEMYQPGKAWPDFLDVKKADLHDPYSESAFEFSSTPNGFKIYSLGKDGKDNGGNGRPTPQGCDIVLTVDGDTVTIEGY